jgi:fermentation-respiration switch protein FrsA (DUF1100 family)
MQLDSTKYKSLIKYVYLALVLIFFINSFIYLGKSLVSTSENTNRVDEYFETEQILCDRVDIPTQDNSHIATYIYMQEAVKDYDNYSVPVIVFVPGANNLKEQHFFKHYNLVKANYAVVSVEQRGHGESGGYFSFYNKEGRDISDVIDFLETNYPQLNTTHVGLIGLSLGAGAALIAQAADDRIFASALYHPFSNNSGFFSVIPLPYYLGFTPGIQLLSPRPLGFHDWSYYLNEAWTNNSAINYVNETNTENLLLLHGSLDTTVDPSYTDDIIERVNGAMREDIQLIVRDGLTHVGNEGDITSFKYVMAWLNHFYKNATIDITDLDLEIGYVQFLSDNFPSLLNVKSSLFMFAGLLLAGIFLTSSFFFMKSKQRIDKTIDPKSKSDQNFDQIRPNNQLNTLKIIGIRSLVILLSLFFSGIYCSLFNPSLLYGFLYYPLFVTIPGLLLIPSNLFNGRSAEISDRLTLSILKSKVKAELKRLVTKQVIFNYLISLILYVTPVVLFIQIFNISAGSTHQTPIVMWNEATVFLFVIVSLIPCVPLLFMRDLPEKYSIIIIPTYIISGLLFTLFIPVVSPPIFPLPVPNLLISVALALICFVFYITARIGQLILQKLTYQNVFVSLNFISVVLTMVIFMRVMRIF